MNALARPYVPRPYAPLAMSLFRERSRCALWAKPGMGKSVMVLTHLDICYRVWGDDYPTLILGPKRVAQNVWTDEVRKWEHLRGLEVVSVTGSTTERVKALGRDAPVYAVNYENLPWLCHTLKGRWPFKRVVADEATRLKGFRLRSGGQRAHALGTVAHTLVQEFIELTGTPSPNGLRDLWGQMWFLDAGERLGRTFGAFEERYFAWRTAKDAMAKGRAGIRQVILPHAQELVHEKLKDICLALDPKDWFDLKEPVVNTVLVDLPPHARSRYRELEKEMFLQLERGTVEAVSTAALTMKCLQFANGAVYMTPEAGEKSPAAVVHDEKLDALEELLNEQAENLLVAYHFRSDLARLLARFPDGADLSAPEGMARFKAGKARLGFGHPAGMGHGVDGLQKHCFTAVVFGHWWDLEQYDQFIERIGPMRQLQAGENRAVFIHHIVAKGTVDEVVSARRATKRGVQDLLLDYMKERS